MQKRRLILGDYDTAAHGLWTLSEWSLTPAAYRSSFVSVPGRDGDLDLSTVLTDGIPTYGSRTLTATLECSDGTRLARDARISAMINQLDGQRLNIQLPDDPLHYLSGRVSVALKYSDLAHAAVTVTAICDPWRYSLDETVITLTATPERQTAQLFNTGRKVVIPSVLIGSGTVQDYTTLYFGDNIKILYAGTYTLPEFTLPPGATTLDYKSTGTQVLGLTYREAIL